MQFNGVGRIVISTADVTFTRDTCAGQLDCAPGRYTRISVQDDGRGMDATTLAQVFEPFFTTKGPGEGTGLGLSIVYGVVRQNGGFIQVESAPGQGTEFRLHLPVDVAGGAREARSEERSAEPSGGQETVLLVEDEPAVLRFARRVLEGAGYRVLAADSPAEALRVAQERGGP